MATWLTYVGIIEEIETGYVVKCPNVPDLIFELANYSSKQETYDAAESFRKIQSDNLHLTYIIFPEIHPYFHLTVAQQQVIAGFLDGDGTVCSSAQYRVSAGQSQDDGVPDIFQHLIQHIPNSVLYKPKPNRKSEKSRQEREWGVLGKNCLPLLHSIALHGIVKAPQARVVLEDIAQTKSTTITQVTRTTNLKNNPCFY